MPREKEMYQENLTRVLDRFPGRELIPLKAVAEWLGMDVRTLSNPKNFAPVKKIGNRYMVAAAALARWLS